MRGALIEVTTAKRQSGRPLAQVGRVAQLGRLARFGRLTVFSVMALLGLLTLAACEPPPPISGEARVADGDSLRIGAASIRLHAIDAPEARQTCRRDGAVWNCGRAAEDELRGLVAGRTIVCTQTDTDSYGRIVARCSNGDVDIGAAMVRSGFALAYDEYGFDYVREEAQAKADRVGLWAGEFEAPWDWRARR